MLLRQYDMQLKTFWIQPDLCFHFQLGPKVLAVLATVTHLRCKETALNEASSISGQASDSRQIAPRVNVLVNVWTRLLKAHACSG